MPVRLLYNLKKTFHDEKHSTCEYCEGCEWREEKDLEARENIRKQS